jgi:RNA polymerase sigma factor for flagellar operon FliA
LVEHYAYLIGKTRQRLLPSCPTRIAPEDLDQEGLIALVRAVDQFDLSRQVKFESYAISMVRGAMLEYLRREDWVPRSIRSKQKQVLRAEETLTAAHGDKVTDEDRARQLELSIDQFYTLFFEATILQLVSLEDLIGDADHSDSDALSVLESVKSADPDPHVTATVSEQRQRLHECVLQLPSLEREVVQLYYYKGLTLKDVAGRIQRSESRAHQLHAQAIHRLSGMLLQQRALFTERPESASPATGRGVGSGRSAARSATRAA